MTRELAALALTCTEDVFALRLSGRSAAAAIGLDESDQVRLATALSELGRQALTQPGSARAAFLIESDGALTVHIEGLASSSPDLVDAVAAARRLVNDLTLTESQDGDVATVRLTRRPRRGFHPEPPVVESAIRKSLSSGPLEDLRIQNQDLISALDDLRAGQDELMRVNSELEETNRGVMAMYSQLSDELEETNRGVVALYAELDGKSLQLKEASDSKSRFLASISHELRSPVNSIVGLVRLLQEEAYDRPDGDDQHVQLGYIDEAASRLSQLVDDLLDLAKAEAGRLQPAITEVRLADVLAELRGAIRPLLAPGVDLQIHASEVECLYTDHTLLIQVLRNLLSNAAKFTEVGTVTVKAAEVAPGRIAITVSDTGVGIAPDQHDRVFEDFYQVRGPLQNRYKGTGLGLGYSRRVARALGGDIELSSRPGVGTEFVLTIPTPGDPSPDSGPARQGQAFVDSALIADDDPAFRLLLRTYLEGLCGRIAEVDGGRAAIDVIRRDRPDVVFLDLAMPDLSGDEVLDIIASDPGCRGVSVVVITSAYSTEVEEGVAGATLRLHKGGLDRHMIETAVATIARREREPD